MLCFSLILEFGLLLIECFGGFLVSVTDEKEDEATIYDGNQTEEIGATAKKLEIESGISSANGFHLVVVDLLEESYPRTGTPSLLVLLTPVQHAPIEVNFSLVLFQ